MASISLSEFEHTIASVCAKSKIILFFTVIKATPTSMTIRVYLVNKLFIDVFYNEVTSKTSYTLIENEQRIFGADNTGGWHLHPFENPTIHLSWSTDLSFCEFVNKIEEQYSYSIQK